MSCRNKSRALSAASFLIQRDKCPAAENQSGQLSEEPEQTHGAIKRLRGKQKATFRLRVQDYRVFDDVVVDRVEII